MYISRERRCALDGVGGEQPLILALAANNASVTTQSPASTASSKCVFFVEPPPPEYLYPPQLLESQGHIPGFHADEFRASPLYTHD